MIKKCVICENEFEARRHDSKYCGKKCKREYHKLNAKHLLTCKHCSNEFKSNNKIQIYCSVACMSKSGICKETGSMSSYPISLEEREIKFKIKFEIKFPKFEYIEGYKDCESKIKCKCKTCGFVKERTSQIIRSKKEVRCDDCFKENSDTKKQNKEELEIVARDKRAKIANERKIKLETKREFLKIPVECGSCSVLFSRSNSKQINCLSCIDKAKATLLQEEEKLKEPIKCKECDKLFKRKRKGVIFCSTRCSDKHGWRINDIRRRKKLKENGIIEWDINIERLIKRDGQVCEICGGDVNLKDFHYTEEGHFIARDKYPSIDHIKPVSKGGTHTWDNVQLAHRQCNSFKCDNEEFIYDAKLLI